jgi:catechol 2,3-dioxygenase-like lactoylglutathione lyase family enzyme
MMMTQTIAVERVDHIGVRVHDLDRALGFYRVLGFDLVRRPENDDVGIIRNEHGVELWPGAVHAKLPRRGGRHLHRQ